jgi:hypothetical protein
MTPSFQKLLTPFLCLVLLEILSGCTIVEILDDVLYTASVTAQPRDPNSHRTGENHYEPKILASNKDWITVKYLSVGPNAEHEQVVQLITEHCDGNYTETNRAELRGYTTVESECTHGNESIQ